MGAPKKKGEAFQPSGDVRRVQTLGFGWRTPGAGRWVRIGDHLGKWRHLSVERDADDLLALVTGIAAENPDLAARVVAELLALDADEFHYLLPAEEPVEA